MNIDFILDGLTKANELQFTLQKFGSSYSEVSNNLIWILCTAYQIEPYEMIETIQKSPVPNQKQFADKCERVIRKTLKDLIQENQE